MQTRRAALCPTRAPARRELDRRTHLVEVGAADRERVELARHDACGGSRDDVVERRRRVAGDDGVHGHDDLELLDGGLEEHATRRERDVDTVTRLDKRVVAGADLRAPLTVDSRPQHRRGRPGTDALAVAQA